MSNVSKLLLFPKPKPAPSPAPIHTLERIITISIGSDRYAVTIQTQIERITARPMDQSSADFPCGRNLEFRKHVPAPEGDNADRTSGPADGPAAEAPPRAKSETLQNNTATAPAPVATVGAEAPNVGSKAGKASRKATRSEKPVTRHGGRTQEG
jgi:hypothetical protein